MIVWGSLIGFNSVSGRKSINTRAVLFPFIPPASIKQQLARITHNAFRLCCVRFYGTTFLETAVYETGLSGTSGQRISLVSVDPSVVWTKSFFQLLLGWDANLS